MSTAKNIIRSYIPRNFRNWLRSPHRSAELAWDEIKYVAGAKETVQMRPDWSLVCHPAAYRCAYFAQDSDPEQVAEFDSFVQNSCQGMVFFDIGAHFGLFSLAALHYGGSQAQAVAVDPSPAASRFIRIQAKLNHVDDRLHVVQASVGDQTGWQSMVSVGVLASGYYVAPSKDHPASELTLTKSVTLDQLVQEFGTLPTHIKIDVEGYEAAVLRGGLHLLSQPSAPMLFLELHNEMVRRNGDDPKETLALLKRLNYQIFAVDSVPVGDDEILSEPLIRVTAKKVGAETESCRQECGQIPNAGSCNYQMGVGISSSSE